MFSSFSFIFLTDNPSYFSVTSEPTTPPIETKNVNNDLENVTDLCEKSVSRQTSHSKTWQNKSSSRSFLRSISSTSADSNQELLIMGEPRFSDIAPDLAVKLPFNEPRRSNSLKNKTEFEQNNDDVFCTLSPENSSGPLDLSDEEIFLSEGKAHYYNFKVNKRRHSISTFTVRERSTSVASSSKSFKDDMSQAVVHSKLEEERSNPIMRTIAIDDHSLRHASYPRKRCNKCSRGE